MMICPFLYRIKCREQLEEELATETTERHREEEEIYLSANSTNFNN